MKYRHTFHAGNFADVHKHVTLLALLRALKKKEKGFFYLDTHAGRGRYDLARHPTEAAAGLERFEAHEHQAEELRAYAALLEAWRTQAARRHSYPGSPLIAASELRRQDRAVLIERERTEAHALEQSLAALAKAGSSLARVHIECADGFARLAAWLPPRERRGLTLIDPPYEETREDFALVGKALAEGVRRFPGGVFAAWYPIKVEREIAPWLATWARDLERPALLSELWLYPRDSRVGLNGSGLLIVNPPWHVRERMEVWLAELAATLASGPAAGSRVQMLSESPR